MHERCIKKGEANMSEKTLNALKIELESIDRAFEDKDLNAVFALVATLVGDVRKLVNEEQEGE